MHIYRFVVFAAVFALPAAAHAAPGDTTGPTPSFNGSVYAIAQLGDTVYVGGAFTTATARGRTYPRDRLAAFDATSGRLLTWAPRADDTVRALAVAGSSVYVAGDFAPHLTAVDADTGEPDPDFTHDLDGRPRALAVGDGRLYLAGAFTTVDGRDHPRLAAFSLADGELDDDWTPATDHTVNSLAYADDRVYLGGDFKLRLTAVDAVTGERDTDFRPEPPAVVNAVTADDDGVYAAMGGVGGRAASFTRTGRTRWTRYFDGDVQAIAVLDGTAYVGGHFDRACTTGRTGPHGYCTDGSVPRVKLAAVDPDGELTGWAPQANGVAGVRVLTADQGTLAAGGDFTTIGGHDQLRCAIFR